jgi:hypothetical protein
MDQLVAITIIELFDVKEFILLRQHERHRLWSQPTYARFAIEDRCSGDVCGLHESQT